MQYFKVVKDDSFYWVIVRVKCEGNNNNNNNNKNQEGGGVSRVNIGRLITTSVTSRHTSMFFQNGGQFSCSLFLQKMTIFRRSGKLFCRARMTKHLKNRKE